ncbi:MAG: ATP-binding cassette domain-containing protein [Alphaproteobacteria bacterium]|nr:ATP-binding cassette domain-containing protein [Alphaproteobacteria bacterium]
MSLEGPSGSGKTRIARALADLEPSSGHIFVNGAERRETPAPEWRKLVRYVSAEPGWWTDTPREALSPDPSTQSAVIGLMENLGLFPELLDKPVSVLSTGERQRLALVRAFADDPPVLILDEPTSALDNRNANLVEDLLTSRLAAGKSIILISHDPEQIVRMADLRLQLAPDREPGTRNQDPPDHKNLPESPTSPTASAK